MSPKRELTLKVDVKQLANEIPLEVIVYERGLDDVVNQLIKTFGHQDVLASVNDAIDWVKKGNKL